MIFLTARRGNSTFLQISAFKIAGQNELLAMLLKIFLCISLLSNFRTAISEKPQIAIIGAGIGGTSCSYFLRDLLKDEVDIDIYETNEIGGRLATAEFDGEVYETGGSDILTRNKYMVKFREKFQLNSVWNLNSEAVIRDSSGNQSFSGKRMIVTALKVMWKYGVISICRLRRFINRLLDDFDKIYEIQEEGRAFATVEELFAAMDPKLVALFKISAEEGFRTMVQVNKKTIDDLIKSTLRANYCQSTDIHLFVAAVSTSCMFVEGWGTQGGNKLLPALLIQEARVTLFKYRVVKITYYPQYKDYIVEFESTSTHERYKNRYDVVVIANPITADSETPIEFANFDSPITVAGQYRRVVSTLVIGHLEPTYFHLSKNNAADIIIDNDDLVIYAIAKATPVNRGRKVEPPVWRIFSQRPLTDKELETMFKPSIRVVNMKDWLAYPKYEKLSVEAGNFVLHDRLFYVNAIEWAASAMEMSVIGAKNVALLVAKALQSTKNV